MADKKETEQEIGKLNASNLCKRVPGGLLIPRYLARRMESLHHSEVKQA